MAGNTTTYFVDTVFRHRQVGAGIMQNIERQARYAATGIGTLQRSMGMLGAVAAGSYGVGRLGQAFIGFNSRVEDATVKMAGLATMFRGGSFAAHIDDATESMQRYQKMAATSALSTKDLTGMAGMISSATEKAGLGNLQRDKLAFGAANFAAAIGEQADVVARDIRQMLAGRVTAVDPAAQMLLSMKGVNLEAEKFNKLSAAGRVSIVERALNSDAIKQMAAAQANTWTGVTSTLMDNVELTMGKIGLPLFKALTKEVKSWNTWLDANQAKVDRWAERFADGLVTGFGYVKDAVGFIVQHRDTLLSIGKVWAAVRIAGMAGGGVQSLGGLLGAGGVGGAGAGIGAGAGRLVPLVGAAVGGWEVGSGIRERIGARKVDDALAPVFSALFDSFGMTSKTTYDLVRAQERYAETLDRIRAKVEARGDISKEQTSHHATMVDVREQQVAVLKKLIAQGEAGYSSAGGWKGDTHQITRQRAIDLGLSESGFHGSGTVKDALKDRYSMAAALEQVQAKLDKLKAKPIETVSKEGDFVYAAALDRLPEWVKESIAAQDATRIATQEMTRMAAAGLPLDPVIVAQALTAAAKAAGASDPTAAQRTDKQTPGTRVTINKVEVAAKDPNRWIAELDRAIGRKIGAPSQAKKARGRGM